MELLMWGIVLGIAAVFGFWATRGEPKSEAERIAETVIDARNASRYTILPGITMLSLVGLSLTTSSPVYQRVDFHRSMISGLSNELSSATLQRPSASRLGDLTKNIFVKEEAGTWQVVYVKQLTQDNYSIRAVKINPVNGAFVGAEGPAATLPFFIIENGRYVPNPAAEEALERQTMIMAALPSLSDPVSRVSAVRVAGAQGHDVTPQ